MEAEEEFYENEEEEPQESDANSVQANLASTSSAAPSTSPASLSQIREIVQDLIDNDLPVSKVERKYHKDVLTTLCVAKNEALHGHLFDRARKIQGIIDQLKISDVDVLATNANTKATTNTTGASIRSRAVFAQTVGITAPTRIPSIVAYKRNDSETEHLKLQSELEVTEHYWTAEIKRFKEMRDAAYKKLLSSQEKEMKDMVNSDLGVEKRETNASRILRKKTENTQSSPEEAKSIMSRADRVDQLEYKHAMKRAKEALQQRIAQLKLDQAEERAVFDRRWDTKWADLQTQMMQEINAKQTPLLKNNNRVLVTPQNERQKMRQSCPVSILSAIIKNK